MEIALRALGIGPGDEVIVPALTWTATAWAVVQVGAVPRFVDVGDDWCLDPDAVRTAITPRTRALIPVHLYDQVADMDQLLTIAKEASLRVVEDCAHAHGSRWGRSGVGTLGDIGSFSFQQSKSMTSGEGGILITNDEALAHEIHGLRERRLTNCGRPWNGMGYGYGGNHRITEFQAALLLPQLERLEEQLARRQQSLQVLRREVSNVPGVEIREPRKKVTRQGLYGVGLRLDPRAFAGLQSDLLVRAIEAEGVPIEKPYTVVYRSALSRPKVWTSGRDRIRLPKGQSAAATLGLRSSCPNAERISEREGLVLNHSLFLGPARDIEDIATALAKVQRCAPQLRFEVFEMKARDAARSLLHKVGRR